MVSLPLPTGIGIANIPNQYQKKAYETGIDYNVMVVGERGLGKTTFVNTLLGMNIESEMKIVTPNDGAASPKSAISGTTRIEERAALFGEMEFVTRFSVIDTPGFGDAANNGGGWEPIVAEIDARYERHYAAQMSTARCSTDRDARIHACLYFISPHGYGLRPLDIRAMQMLSIRCNVVPIIAKADLLTLTELAALKAHIKDTLMANKILTFDLLQSNVNFDGAAAATSANNETSVSSTPALESIRALDEDEESARMRKEIFSSFPLAVIGANCYSPQVAAARSGANGQPQPSRFSKSSDAEAAIGGSRLVREYTWAAVDIENDAYCDYKKVRSLLFRMYMHDLIDATEKIHYQRFRSVKLMQLLHSINARKTDSSSKSNSYATKAGGGYDLFAHNGPAAFQSEAQLKAEEISLELKNFAQKEESRLKDYEMAVRGLKERLEKEIEREHCEVKQLHEKLLGYSTASGAKKN